jgi:hypothetical protein
MTRSNPYSERVQKRMKKLSFEAKEAERQRQALAREREELLRVSQTFHSENEKLQPAAPAERGYSRRSGKGAP